MSARSREEAAERLRLALGLFAAGEALVRQNAKRRFGDASPEEIEARVIAWLSRRPGPEPGDAQENPGRWPRRR